MSSASSDCGATPLAAGAHPGDVVQQLGLGEQHLLTGAHFGAQVETVWHFGAQVETVWHFGAQVETVWHFGAQLV